MTATFTIACKEFEDRLRNGWILAISLAFAVFALVIGVSGFGVAGIVGATNSEATIISLTSLVLYLIPLLGLLLGYDGIAGEQEQGTLDLLRVYPVQATDLVLGKWLGLGIVLSVVFILGLAIPAGLAVASGHALLPWLVFAGLSIWLGAIFIALALWLSTLATQRGTVLGLASMPMAAPGDFVRCGGNRIARRHRWRPAAGTRQWALFSQPRQSVPVPESGLSPGSRHPGRHGFRGAHPADLERTGSVGSMGSRPPVPRRPCVTTSGLSAAHLNEWGKCS